MRRVTATDRYRRVAKPGVVALAAIALAACSGGSGELVDHRLYAMGTWVDLSLPPGSSNRQSAATLDAIESELRQFEIDYYAWADGELAALNQALTAGESFAASASMAALIGTAQALARQSGGAFDPGVGTLVALWGFAGPEPPAALPSAAAIAATLSLAGSIETLEIEGRLIRSGANDTGLSWTLDLGGIAKGAAVDRIVDRLAALAIEPALVNAGGDLRVIGTRPDRDWRIGIQAPRGDGLLGSIGLTDGEAAFTSGDYERFVERDGERLHHILDPRTGFPVTATRAVTVIAASGTLADAAATALFVAADDWEAVAGRLGVEAVLRVDAGGNIEMTPAMRDRFRPLQADASDIIVAAD